MTPFDRQVRAQIYQLMVAGAQLVDAETIGLSRGWDQGEVEKALERLEAEHRIALVDQSHRIRMAHPFSGVETGYRSVIGDRSWFANCAWDALAVLALLGDGEAMVGDLEWKVSEGVVQPDGLVHLVVPARQFWDDVGFT